MLLTTPLGFLIEKRGYGSMGRYIEHKKRSGALNQILPRDCLVPNGELDLGRFVLDCFCISLIDKAVRNPGPRLSGHWCTGQTFETTSMCSSGFRWCYMNTVQQTTFSHTGDMWIRPGNIYLYIRIYRQMFSTVIKKNQSGPKLS